MTSQELRRLDQESLVRHGRHALRDGEYARAASLLREAVRRAPLRQELRDLLATAVEGTMLNEPGGEAPALPPEAPRQAPGRTTGGAGRATEEYEWSWPDPPPARRPEAPEDEFLPPAERRPRGEAARPVHDPGEDETLDEATERPGPVRARRIDTPPPMEPPPPPPARPIVRRSDGLRAPAAPARPVEPAPAPEPAGQGTGGRNASVLGRGGSPAPPAAGVAGGKARRPKDFAKRHERGPLSALLVGMLVGLALLGVVGAGVWIYLHPPEVGPLAGLGETARLNAAVEQAELFKAKGQYAQAAEQLENLPASPRRDRALGRLYMDIGDIALRRENLPGAIDAYVKAAQLVPDEPSYGIGLGLAFYQLAQETMERDAARGRELLDRAIQSYQAVSERNPTNQEALLEIARAARAKGDVVMQAEAYRRARRIDPDTEAGRDAARNLKELNLAP